MDNSINQEPKNNIWGLNLRRDVALFVWETVKIILISLAIILPIRYYLVQPFFVKGQSMEDNFQDGDYLVVDEIGYRLHSPKRGDVVIFHYPGDPSQFYIKRIIGLPGETVKIENNQVVIYNEQYKEGLILKEDYLADYQRTDHGLRMQVGANEFFVLGDNRLQSSDSRYWGAVPKKLIVGRALLRLWPLDKIIKVPGVNYISN